MAEAFTNDPERNFLDGNTLYASSVFRWYSEDFNGDVFGFFMKYAKGDLKERLKMEGKEIRVGYLDYDWSLNGK
jgi:hypothetical protein